MELFMAIALLCQVNAVHNKQHDALTYDTADKLQLECQQSYTHCINTKTSMSQTEAMTKCVMERKL